MTDWFLLWDICFQTQAVGQRPKTVIQTTVLVKSWVKAGGHKGPRPAQWFQRKTLSSEMNAKH